MRRLGKVLKRIVLLCGCLVILFLGLAGYWTWAGQPRLEGEIHHPSLTGEVTLIRDDWGVPHIEAEAERDAYFALGYAMAQERLFQMELLRRLASGRLAELLGPPLVEIDTLIRTFRLRPKAEEIMSRQAAGDPQLFACAEAFLAGVNHRVETEPLPLEFKLLAIPKPHYTLVDCFVVAAILPITFADGLRGDALYALLESRCPAMEVEALFPGYHKGLHATVMESLEEARDFLKEEANLEAAPQQLVQRRDHLEGLGKVLEILDPFTQHFGQALGSNSWVLAGSRTQSGKPILANDPHIGFTNPSIWYEAHLKCPAFENYGYYFPLIPVALLGHNTRQAWGLTMFENDDVDLFREELNPENPKQVRYKGEWVSLREEKETIRVRFGRDRDITIRLTPHGPIITDLLNKVMGYDGPPVAMSWVWQQVEYTDIEAFYRMNRAQSYADFEAGVALVTSPGLNISYADCDGIIAWWAAGKIPIRPDHVNHKSLLDGASGKDELLGFVPFADNPHLKNPSCGYIATANNKSTVKPVGAIKDLQGYWQPDDRAARIEQLIESQDRWSLESLKAMQFDDTAWAAPKILACLLGVIDTAEAAFSPLEQQALAILRDWDGRHHTESTGASIYQQFCDYLLRRCIEDELGPELYSSYGSLADHWNFFKYMIHEPDLAFWDDVQTKATENREGIVVNAFRSAVARLRMDLGDDPAAWHWGRIHTMEFKHPFGYLPLLGKIFNIGPFPSSGASQVINNMLYPHGSNRYDVIAGPSTRRLIDFGDPEHSLSILPTGNSGIFTSPHYDDQAPLFMQGAYRAVRYTPEQIAEHEENRLRFVGK